MNVLSLFDGIRCGRIALERAGINVDNYYSSEVDKYAVQVADKNYPEDIENKLGDVTKIDLSKLPKIDLLIGGSPCVGFSLAGKKNGMSTKENVKIISLNQYLKLKEEGFEFDGQSYLFWEFVNALHILKPKYWMLEIVKMNKKWLDIINFTLGEKAIEINSSLLSAQNRKRLYWFNWEIDDIIPNNIELKTILENKEFKEVVFNANQKLKFDKINTTSIKMGTLTEATVSRGGSSYEYLSMLKRVKMITNKLRKLTPIECERLQTLPDNYTSGVSNSQRYKMIGNGWTVDVIAHIFKGLREE